MNDPSNLSSSGLRKRLQRTCETARTRVRRAFPFASGVLAALLAILFYNLFISNQPALTTDDVNDAVAMALASATPPPPFSARVYQVIQPSLVFIQAQVPDSENNEGEYSVGSGVIISDRGDILTSLHVVEDAVDIQLIFADGTHATGQVTAAIPENDIAVLSTSQLPGVFLPATLGNPDAMQVGDEAFAVGNPFGLYGSMSSGVISGFDRSFKPSDSDQRLENLIQIDAAVNPGNSGGPLLNRSGHVVGIVVGIVNPTEDEFFIGIGFAVPIQIAATAVGSPLY